jgi:hypothetical protein
MRTRVPAEASVAIIEGEQSVIEIELRADRDRILHRNNAQEILQALATLEERRAEFTTRWLWESIQNARDFPDPSRRMTIRINLTADRITFAHNGRDFTREEILSLIYHGSTKKANEEQLGKFGTGFLSTHLLSRQVRVKGTLREEKHGRRAFEFELDRSGDDPDQVGDAMQRSFFDMTACLASSSSPPSLSRRQPRFPEIGRKAPTWRHCVLRHCLRKEIDWIMRSISPLCL